MNVPIEISSLADYIDRINDITDPEVNYIYRGQRNAEWQVSSSAYHRLLNVQPDTEPELLANLFVGYLKQITESTLFSDLIGFFERNTHAHLYDLSLAEPYYGEN